MIFATPIGSHHSREANGVQCGPLVRSIFGGSLFLRSVNFTRNHGPYNRAALYLHFLMCFQINYTVTLSIAHKDLLRASLQVSFGWLTEQPPPLSPGKY